MKQITSAEIREMNSKPADTQTPSLEPASVPPTDAGSPLSLVESHARLSLHATKLGESVKAAKVRSDEAVALYRKLRDELDELERGLRALNRVTHPRRRVK